MLSHYFVTNRYSSSYIFNSSTAATKLHPIGETKLPPFSLSLSILLSIMILSCSFSPVQVAIPPLLKTLNDELILLTIFIFFKLLFFSDSAINFSSQALYQCSFAYCIQGSPNKQYTQGNLKLLLFTLSSHSVSCLFDFTNNLLHLFLVW